jgi:hypothetical protein
MGMLPLLVCYTSSCSYNNSSDSSSSSSMVKSVVGCGEGTHSFYSSSSNSSNWGRQVQSGLSPVHSYIWGIHRAGSRQQKQQQQQRKAWLPTGAA